MAFDHIEDRLEAVKTLTKLLLHEIESLAEMAATNGNRVEATTGNLSDRVQRYEVALICNALIESHGNQRKAAKRLGIKPPTLHAKIRRYDIDSVRLFGQFPDEAGLEKRKQISEQI